MKNLENYGVQELNAQEVNQVDGGNTILRGVAYLMSALASGWEAYESNGCNGGCNPVGMSGSAGLGNTPYHF